MGQFIYGRSERIPQVNSQTRYKMKRICIVLASLLAMFALSACAGKEIQIFKDKDAKYKLSVNKDEVLENDQYYIKEGTNFYKPYNGEGTLEGETEKPESDRVMYFNKDKNLIPTLYSNELIAYQSEVMDMKPVYLERLKDLGYSIGLYNGQRDNGYIVYQKKGVVADSSLASLLPNEYEEVRIQAINDVYANDLELSAGGVITGLTADTEYQVKMFIGTKYVEVTVTADEWFMESYETMLLDDLAATKNGYIALKMPDKSKSGYYNIAGKGVFKYYDKERADVTGSEDMNEPFYSSEDSQLNAYTQQYIVSLKKRVVNLQINIQCEDDLDKINGAYALLTAPNKVVYTMDMNKNGFSIRIAEAVAGTWKINIYPKSLTITDVKTSSDSPKADAIEEVKDFVLAEDETDMMFKLILTKEEGSNIEGEAWATVEYEDGTLYSFEKENLSSSRTSDEYICMMPYATAGAYKVTVYHYNDTEIYSCDFIHTDDYQDTEIIIVESD